MAPSHAPRPRPIRGAPRVLTREGGTHDQGPYEDDQTAVTGDVSWMIGTGDLTGMWGGSMMGCEIESDVRRHVLWLLSLGVLLATLVRVQSFQMDGSLCGETWEA